MSNENRFSDYIAEKLQHYVYRLIDPRNGTTFYVGRGRGNRVFSHAAGKEPPSDAEDTETLKLRTIWDIQKTGFDVEHVIHRHGLTEDAAREVEAALIDAYPGLTNIQPGYANDRAVMHARQVIALYQAPEAVPHHKLILINVNISCEEDSNLLDAVRYAWKISPKTAREADYVLAVRRGMIIGAFVADRWLEATPENFPGLYRPPDQYGPRDGRYGFVGREAPEDIRRLYVQKRVPDTLRKRGAANPIRYWNMDNIAIGE